MPFSTQHEITPNELTILEVIEKQLPPVFDRHTASKILGGILTPKTLSNADTSGTGPSVKVKIGKKIAYERDSFIEWLKNKVR